MGADVTGEEKRQVGQERVERAATWSCGRRSWKRAKKRDSVMMVQRRRVQVVNDAMCTPNYRSSYRFIIR
jgi:hypothetical protein